MLYFPGRFHYLQSLSRLIMNYLPEHMTCRWPEGLSNWHWCRIVSLSALQQIEMLVFNVMTLDEAPFESAGISKSIYPHGPPKTDEH